MAIVETPGDGREDPCGAVVEAAVERRIVAPRPCSDIDEKQCRHELRLANASPGPDERGRCQERDHEMRRQVEDVGIADVVAEREQYVRQKYFEYECGLL